MNRGNRSQLSFSVWAFRGYRVIGIYCSSRRVDNTDRAHALRIAARTLLLICALTVLLPKQNLKAQIDGAASHTVTITHGEPDALVPYSESRTITDNERLISVDGRTLSMSQIKLLSAARGAHADEYPASTAEGAGGVIIELHQAPVAEVYGTIRDSHGSKAGIRSLSRDEAQALEQQAIRIMEQQDLVLNRLAGLLAVSGGAHPGAGVTSAKPITRLQTTFSGLGLRDVSIRDVQQIVDNDPALTRVVRRVLPDTPVYANLLTSVPEISAHRVWEHTSSQGIPLNGAGIRIGIIDTGVDYTHPDLGGCFGPTCKVAAGYDFVNRDGDPMDDHGHGTHCAATAAGDGRYVDPAGNTKPFQGVAPGATIYAYKVLSAAGPGLSSDVIAALERCADPNQDGNLSDHLEVCSLSLGGPGGPDDPTSLAADAASRAGVVVVVAAGNSGPSAGTIESPGSSRLAVTVAAACKTGATGWACNNGPIASFSARGPIAGFPEISKPDVAAPGVDICAARFGNYAPGMECMDGTRVAIAGTSMATPHVAGVAALLAQAHPGIPPELIKEAIISTATDLGQPREAQGGGLVHALQALEALGIPSSLARIDGAPVLIDITPTTNVADISKSIVVKSLASSPLEFVASFSTNQAGVSGTVSPNSATIAPGAAATFTIRTLTDINQVASGERWRGNLTFNTTQGEVSTAVYGFVRDRLVSPTRAIDLGLKSGADLSWRDSASVRLTNVLTQTSATYQVSVSCCGTGSNLTSNGIRGFSDSSSITIPPQSTVDLPVFFEATGVDSGNGRYKGEVVLTSPHQTLKVPITLFKGWAFRFKYNQSERAPMLARLHKPGISFYEFLNPGRTESFFIVTEPGPWHADVHFHSGTSDEIEHIVFRTFIPTTSTVNELTFRASEARQLITVPIRRPNGEPITKGLTVMSINNRRGQSNFITLFTPGFQRGKLKTRVNIFSPDIKVEASSHHVHESTILAWNQFLIGDSRTGDVEVPQPPFITKYVSAPSNQVTTDATHLFVSSCLRGSCVGLTDSVAKIPREEVGILHTSSNQSLLPSDPLFAELPRTFLEAWPSSRDPLSSSPLHAVFSAGLYVSGAGALSRVYWGGSYPFRPGDRSKYTNIPAGHGDSIGLGAGPEANVGSWYNYANSSSWYTSRFGYSAPTYMSAGGATDFFNSGNSRLITYTLNRNGQRHWSRSEKTGRALPGVLSPGTYDFKAERSSLINGITTTSKTENTFRVVSLAEHSQTPVDENPPALTHITLLANNIVQNTLDPSVANSLRFGLDPQPGLLRPSTGAGDFEHDLMQDGLASVSIEQSSNGTEWSTLAHETVSNGEFRAELPIFGNTQLYHFRIKASDLAANTFTYTFQVPAGTALIVPSPTNTPQPTPTYTPTPTSTPRPTHTATPTPTATQTPFNSPNPGPVLTATPGFGSDGAAQTLPKPIVRVKKKALLVSLPSIASISFDTERVHAVTQLRALGLSEQDVRNYADSSKSIGRCTVSVRQKKKHRTKPATLSFFRGLTTRFGKPPQKAPRISYRCQFYSAPPYNLVLGPARQSPEVVFSRTSRKRG